MKIIYEAELQQVIDALVVYESLSPKEYPGPPTTALATLRAVQEREGPKLSKWMTYERNGYYVVSPSVEEAETSFPGRDHIPLYTLPEEPK